MLYKNMPLDLLKVVSPPRIISYIESSKWKKAKELENVILYNSESSGEQVLIPLKTDFDDYAERIGDAINIISRFEKRDNIEILNDLLLPPSDTIRFKIENPSSKSGTLPILDGIDLFENSRKMVKISGIQSGLKSNDENRRL